MTNGGNKFTRKAFAGLTAVNRPLCNAARNAAGALLMAMTAIVLLQIVFRYVLNDSLIWTEEVAKTMMVWAAFLVAPWAYRVSANVSIDMFVDALSARLRLLLHLALNLLVIWIVTVFLLESFGFWQRGFSIRTASLPMQMGWFYSVVPFAFAAMLLVGVELLFRDILSLLHPDEDFSIPAPDAVVQGE